MSEIHHALVLNLHQPAGNLEHLLEHEPWEAEQILCAIDRIPRSLWPYEDLARVHLSLSGTLLETLARPDFQARVYGMVKCGDLLWYLQNRRIIEILGSAVGVATVLIVASERALIGGEVDSASASVSSSER